jgi:hypothetical protein
LRKRETRVRASTVKAVNEMLIDCAISPTSQHHWSEELKKRRAVRDRTMTEPRPEPMRRRTCLALVWASEMRLAMSLCM